MLSASLRPAQVRVNERRRQFGSRSSLRPPGMGFTIRRSHPARHSRSRARVPCLAGDRRPPRSHALSDPFQLSRSSRAVRIHPDRGDAVVEGAPVKSTAVCGCTGVVWLTKPAPIRRSTLRPISPQRPATYLAARSPPAQDCLPLGGQAGSALIHHGASKPMLITHHSAARPAHSDVNGAAGAGWQPAIPPHHLGWDRRRRSHPCPTLPSTAGGNRAPATKPADTLSVPFRRGDNHAQQFGTIRIDEMLLS
jgi:hypothetical protein